MVQAVVSVLMPTFKQAHFIPRAIDSLLAQTLTEWELLIVDNGSPDETCSVVAPYLSDTRISYTRLEQNSGLGHALNYALNRASAPLIAYLPSDDVYYPEHLQSLAACLEASPQAVLAYSGLRYHYNRFFPELVPGSCLQQLRCNVQAARERFTFDYHVEKLVEFFRQVIKQFRRSR